MTTARSSRPIRNPVAPRRIFDQCRIEHIMARSYTSLDGVTPAAFAGRPQQGQMERDPAYERGLIPCSVNHHRGSGGLSIVATCSVFSLSVTANTGKTLHALLMNFRMPNGVSLCIEQLRMLVEASTA